MNFLFLFLDGVGLGSPDPAKNPFAKTKMPVLQNLLNGKQMLAFTHPVESRRASLLALDACLGVDGMPQSATGQATLLTGQNVPASIGYHYGPKPNPQVAEFLRNGNIFSTLCNAGQRATFLNAYPPRYFQAIESGLRMYSAIPLAATSAGITLKTADDLAKGEALSADLTSEGWRDHLGITNTTVLSPFQAGRRLGEIAQSYDFAFFEYWLSDYAGHRQDMEQAVTLLKTLDAVLEGLLDVWEDNDGLILLTSDHGNLEDLSTRRHTQNPVPALLIGASELRRAFCDDLKNLADIAPSITDLLVRNPQINSYK
jgi:2,3-bisphosphoglycerate-independent phosphoglycerate mutase